MTQVPGRVSIIIPSYNYGQYLPECIESVLKQSYSNWEAIIVDDGSSDQTPQIAEKLLLKSPDKLRYYRRENQGVTAARNFGLTQAQGEYILPLDADDLLKTHALESFVRALSKEKSAGFAFCAIEHLHEPYGHVHTWEPGSFLQHRFIFDNMASCTTLWRKSLYDSGVKYRETIYEDWDLWLQILTHGYSATYVPDHLFLYRIHESGRNTLNKHRLHLGLMQEICLNPGLYPEEVQQYTQRAWANAPACISKPTIAVLCASTLQTDSPLYSLIESFCEQGFYVAAIGLPEYFPLMPPGSSIVPYPARVDYGFTIAKLNSCGAQLIVLSELAPEFNQYLLTLENLQTLINIGPQQHSLIGTQLELSESSSRFSCHVIGKSTIHKAHAALITDILDLHNNNFQMHSQSFERKRKRLAELRELTPILPEVEFSTPQLRTAMVLEHFDQSLEQLEISLYSMLATEHYSACPITVCGHNLTPELSALFEKYQVQCLFDPEASISELMNQAATLHEADWVIFSSTNNIWGPFLLPYLERYIEAFGGAALYLSNTRRLLPTSAGELDIPFSAELYFNFFKQSRSAYQPRSSLLCLSRALFSELEGFTPRSFLMHQRFEEFAVRAQLQKNTSCIWCPDGLILEQWSARILPVLAKKQFDDYMLALRRSIMPAQALLPLESFSLSDLQQTIAEYQEEAQRMQNHALSEDPELSDRIGAMLSWAYHMNTQNQPLSAIPILRDVLYMSAENNDAIAGLAWAYLTLGDVARSSHFTALLLEKNPEHALGKDIKRMLDQALQR